MNTCAYCGQQPSGFYGSSLRYLWKTQKYVCENCLCNRSAYDGNDTVVGQATLLPSFSFEFEVGNNELILEELGGYTTTTDTVYDDEAEEWVEEEIEVEIDDVEQLDSDDVENFYAHAMELLSVGFERHGDCTVHAEYKSPIFRNMHSLIECESVLSGCEGLVGDEAGTHIHVGIRHKDELMRVYSVVFMPLLREMNNNPETMEEVWGRRFGEYCRMTASNRYCAINLHTSYDTIEYRLSRFVSTRQFFNLVNMVRKFTFVIDRELDKETPELEYLAQLLLDIYHKHTAILEGGEKVKLDLSPKLITHPVVTVQYFTHIVKANSYYRMHRIENNLSENCERIDEIGDMRLEITSTHTWQTLEELLWWHEGEYDVLVSNKSFYWMK